MNLNWELILTTLATTFLALIVYETITYQKVELSSGNVYRKVGIPGTSEGGESESEDS